MMGDKYSSIEKNIATKISNKFKGKLYAEIIDD
jgi:hypothetical protein